MRVQSLRPELTQDDILRLMKGETPEARASVAHRLCRRMALDVLTQQERAYAEEIMTILARDTAELVRRTLAITLRNSPLLPRGLALELAQDVETVAIPILENSPAFTEQDLIELVLSATSAKQTAIANRGEVTCTLAEVIAEHAAVEAVKTLAANPGADMTDKAFADTIERFPRDEGVQAAIVGREHVPMHIAEKMVSLVSGKVFDLLVNRHQLPAQMAIELASNARERATVDLVDQAGRTEDLPRFVSQLNLNGRLTHSLILRALCVGHMSFVEHALAELSGVPHQRVWLMVHDAGPLGLQAVFDRAALPRRFLPVFRAAVGVYHDTQHDGGRDDRTRFRLRMIERVLTQIQSLPREDVDYLLEKLDAYSEAIESGESDAA
ncbi:MAG: DUF2336 domain-containing protein [Pseudomonadota bacterium]